LPFFPLFPEVAGEIVGAEICGADLFGPIVGAWGGVDGTEVIGAKVG